MHEREATPDAEAPVARVEKAPAAAHPLGLLAAGGNRAVARLMAPGDNAPDLDAAAVLAGRLGRGEPLDEGLRAKYEQGYDADLSGVRVHQDAEAAALAESLQARAFTVGQDVFFGAGEYAPGSAGGDHVMAHELAHTVQGGGGALADGPGIVVSDPASAAEREAESAAERVTRGQPARITGSGGGAGLVARRMPGDLSDTDLLLTVRLGGTSASWVFPVTELDQTLLDTLRAEPAKIAAIEVQIGAALTDDGGAMHEGQLYLESPPVADDLKRDVNAWPAAGQLPRFVARFSARAAAVRNTHLRYPVEQSLIASNTLWPGDIDWAKEAAALRGHSPGPDRTVIDAARNDRFELALTVLEREGREGPEPAAGLSAHPAVLGPLLFAKYAATDPAPSELQTGELTRTHSEAFLTLWLPTIRDVKLVPDGFDLAGFAPTGELDQLRRDLLTRYVAEAAPRTMEKFLLDRWVSDGRSPEKFVQTADITGLRGNLLDHLAKDFPRWAATQPGFTGALWSDAGQRTAFAALQTLVLSARGLQSFHAGLADRFATASPADLSDEEFAIAQDPYGYSQRAASTAASTIALTQQLKPGNLLERGLMSWYDAIAATWSMTDADAGPVARLLALFQAMGGLKQAIEAQRDASKLQIAGQLDTGYEKIAEVIRGEAQYADEFVKGTWVPMLKTVALDQVTKNRDEMRDHITNWPQYRAEAAARFRICAHFLDDLITRLQSGEIESATVNDQQITTAELPAMIQARDFFKGQADKLESDAGAEAKKDEMREAVDGFDKVRQRILDGDYEPVDYAKAVFDEARSRLGLTGYEDYITLGQALDRWAVVPQNPFVAYAIARWQWEEHVKQLDHDFLVFTALGLLTVASLVVPGAAGAVLAALDMSAGIAMGAKGVSDAYKLVDLAALDPAGAVGGVTVEQARAALHTAWIGFGLNLLLVGGLGAIWGVLRLAGRGAGKIPAELTHLSALIKVNPVAAEKMIAQVKDLVKLEELLATTGDSLLLERMLAKTTDIKHLEYALMFGDPAKIGELLERAGDAGTLGRILDHVPSTEAAGRLFALTEDSQGLASLVAKTQNGDIAEVLLQWTDVKSAEQLVDLAGANQAGLPALSKSGLSVPSALRVLPRCDDASALAALVKRMDGGPEQVVGLLEKAGNSATLNKILDHVPAAANAEKLLALTTDADRLIAMLELTKDTEGLELLLARADNAEVGLAMVKWAGPRQGEQLLGLAGGNQGGLVTLSTSGLSPASAARALPHCADAGELAALVTRMDKSPEQVVGLVEKHTRAEVNGVLDRGIRASDAEMGIGFPDLGTQPQFEIAKIPMPAEEKAVLAEYGLDTHPKLQECAQHELRRIKAMKNGGGLVDTVPKTVRDNAARWAADGSNGLGDFVDRWDYYKTRVGETAKTLDPKAFPNKNLKVAAAEQIDTDLTQLDRVLTDRAQEVRDLGGIGWADLGEPATEESIRKNATRLAFGGEANAAYHPIKHLGELPLAERPVSESFSDAATAYLTSARRTIAEGTPVIETKDGATTIFYTRTTADREMRVIVVGRDRWALIASLTGKKL
ncbi:DUF4157 domain-containing protein [Actinoplanes sp. NPDC026619]|uniref:eCIS core domain-containing protein n=1 Tax=Actinoplanes sp. NPDC026619 TaxID=3155798 RepID=UPI0033EA584F